MRDSSRGSDSLQHTVNKNFYLSITHLRILHFLYKRGFGVLGFWARARVKVRVDGLNPIPDGRMATASGS